MCLYVNYYHGTNKGPEGVFLRLRRGEAILTLRYSTSKPYERIRSREGLHQKVRLRGYKCVCRQKVGVS